MKFNKIKKYGFFFLCTLIVSISLPTGKLNEESTVTNEEKKADQTITDFTTTDMNKPLTQAKFDFEIEWAGFMKDMEPATEKGLGQEPEGDLVQSIDEQRLDEDKSIPAFSGKEERPMTRTQQSPTVLSEDKLENPRIVVKKGERILELWDGDSLYGSYPIGLGWEPEGHKQREGDGRTPEGSYYVCVRNSNSRFYLSLGVSYPNKEDAKKALEEERIDQSTYDQIATAIDSGAQPPWYTPLGGEIMIHGMGSASDWTAGCIAVDNEVMDILWKFCPISTPILILP